MVSKLRGIAAIADRFQTDMPIEEFRRLDREFHWAIAQACANNLLAEVYFKVLDALFSSDEFSELLHATSNRDEVALIVEQAVRQHRAIADAIREGDPVQVVAVVEDHLGDIERRMIERLV